MVTNERPKTKEEKLLEDYCLHMADLVLQGLEEHVGIRPQIGGQRGHYIPSVRNSSRVLVIKLSQLHPTFSRKITGHQNELGQWAGLSDRDAQIRIGWVGKNIILQVPKARRHWHMVTIAHLAERHAFRRGHRVALGLDALEDRPVRIDFNQPDLAHISISGQTRSGKTTAQRLIAWDLCAHSDQSETGLIIFDIAKKGYKWGDFGQVAQLMHPIVTDLTEGDRVLAWLITEIDRRARLNKSDWGPRIFCFIDELKALVDDSTIARTYIARLASVSGEFNIHLVLATQYPQIQMLGDPALKRNITTRIVGKVDDAKAAENATGRAGSGAERLLGFGDMLLLRDEFTRFTAANIDASPRYVAELERGPGRYLALPDLQNAQGTEIASVKLPESAGPGRQMEPITGEMIGRGLLALPPMGDRKLSQELHIGSGRAQRLNQLLREIRGYAERESLKCIKFE